ncbi:hypothetical protein [Silicimonas sp. MF1-12-2]|uniref:hypothetical protein n=1 Tax=Silicimonas sp. MF1-12-2 TaxID=3384793 RepID=UPI0039B57E9A
MRTPKVLAMIHASVGHDFASSPKIRSKLKNSPEKAKVLRIFFQSESETSLSAPAKTKGLNAAAQQYTDRRNHSERKLPRHVVSPSTSCARPTKSLPIVWAGVPTGNFREDGGKRSGRHKPGS